MAETEEISRFVTSAFTKWRTSGINFLVLRNYEQLPHYAPPGRS